MTLDSKLNLMSTVFFLFGFALVGLAFLSAGDAMPMEIAGTLVGAGFGVTISRVIFRYHVVESRVAGRLEVRP